MNPMRTKLKGYIIMEIIEIECAKCRKKIYVEKNYAKENMFCTIGCMDWSKVAKIIKRREDFL